MVQNSRPEVPEPFWNPFWGSHVVRIDAHHHVHACRQPLGTEFRRCTYAPVDVGPTDPREDVGEHPGRLWDARSAGLAPLQQRARGPIILSIYMLTTS